MSKKATPETFWRRVIKTHSGCWLWTGATNNSGYGTLTYRGRAATAHRTAAFLSGLVDSTDAPKNRKGTGFILHACDNRRCCNPAHMRIGTYAENQLEAYDRRRRVAYRGAAHPNARQTDKSLALIKDMRAHGVSQEAIAKLLNVSQASISKITLGKTYVEAVCSNSNNRYGDILGPQGRLLTFRDDNRGVHTP